MKNELISEYITQTGGHKDAHELHSGELLSIPGDNYVRENV